MGTRIRLLLAGGLWAGLLAGCPFSFTNEDHCAAQAGDATCAQADPSRPYCALDGCTLYDEVDNRTGCVAEQPSRAECYSPCGGKQDANTNANCESPETDTDPTSGTDTEPQPTSSTTEGPGSSSESGGCSCDPATPVCVDGTCMACTDDAFCADLSADEPLCFGLDCVSCRPLITPFFIGHEGCDAVGTEGGSPNCLDGACETKCLFHEDCPGTGCDFRTGLCGPTDVVLYVAAGGNDDADGSEDAPLATVGAAIERIGIQTRDEPFKMGTILLGSGMYTEALAFGSRTVVLRAADPEGVPPVMRAPEPAKGEDPAPVFHLLRSTADNPGGGILSVQGIVFEDSPGPVAQVESATRFFADDVAMLGNGAAILNVGGAAFLRNSVVAGGETTPFVFSDPSEFAVVASTIIDNSAALWFDCSGEGANSQISIRDSIVGNFGGEAFSTLHSAECVVVDDGPLRSVVGDVGAQGAFRVDEHYRLDASPGEMYQLDEDVGFCEPGVAIDPGAFLKPCPPTRDVDGKDRTGQNWVGFSVP